MTRRPLRTRVVEPGGAPARTPPLAVDLAEAARLLSLAPRTVRRLASTGEIPYVRIGRALRFETAVLADFVARHRVGAP